MEINKENKKCLSRNFKECVGKQNIYSLNLFHVNRIDKNCQNVSKELLFVFWYKCFEFEMIFKDNNVSAFCLVTMTIVVL